MGERMTRARTAVAMLIALASAVAPASALAEGDRCPHANDRPGKAEPKALEAATLCLLSAEREARGLRPLASRGLLRAAALDHSREMVAQHYFAHRTQAGRTLIARLTTVRYLSDQLRWVVAENLAWG